MAKFDFSHVGKQIKEQKSQYEEWLEGLSLEELHKESNSIKNEYSGYLNLLDKDFLKEENQKKMAVLRNKMVIISRVLLRGQKEL